MMASLKHVCLQLYLLVTLSNAFLFVLFLFVCGSGNGSGTLTTPLGTKNKHWNLFLFPYSFGRLFLSDETNKLITWKMHRIWTRTTVAIIAEAATKVKLPANQPNSQSSEYSRSKCKMKCFKIGLVINIKAIMFLLP